MNDGRERIIKQAERNNEKFIVAGAHWSWGSGYPTEEAAEAVLNANKVAFAYHACPNCGQWIAGLSPRSCTPCALKL